MGAGRGARRDRNGFPAWIPAILLLAAAIALVAYVVGDEDDPGETIVTTPGAVRSIEEVAEADEELVGERVRVRGEVSDVLIWPGAFVLEGNHGNSVLVVPRAGTFLPPISRGDTIVATGTVHVIDEPGLEDEIDRELRIDFDNPPFDPYRDVPLLLAGDVDEMLPGTANPDPPATVANLIAQPSQFVGEPVLVRGEVSAARIPGQGFVLGGEAQDERLPIVPAAGATLGQFGEERLVIVSGTVHEFGEEGLEKAVAEGVDLEADVLNAFRDGPLVVASDADARGEVE